MVDILSMKERIKRLKSKIAVRVRLRVEMGNIALRGVTSGAGHDARREWQRPFLAILAQPPFSWAVEPNEPKESETLADF